MSVGERIEAIWKAKRAAGLPALELVTDLKQLSAYLGVSYETLRKWKRNEASPSAPRQKKIAEKLQCTVADFMFEATPSVDDTSLSDEEMRLLRAFRSVLRADRAETVARLEKRAAELVAIRSEIATEEAGGGELSPAAEKRQRAA